MTPEAINAYEKEYRCKYFLIIDSELERKDVLAFYVKCKGVLLDISIIRRNSSLVDCVTCSRLEDIDRFKKIIEEAINSGEVPSFRAFPKINKRDLEKRMKQAENEAKEVAGMKKEKDDGLDALRLAIQAKNQDR